MPARFPVLDSAACVPCGLCEVACVEARYGWHDLAPDDPRVLERRRLRVREVAGLPALDVCFHCAESPCVPACPHDALLRFRDGRVELIESRCTGCGKCIAACPHGAIRRVVDLDIAVKCDGCAPLGGEPACVPACPSKALSLTVR